MATVKSSKKGVGGATASLDTAPVTGRIRMPPQNGILHLITLRRAFLPNHKPPLNQGVRMEVHAADAAFWPKIQRK